MGYGVVANEELYFQSHRSGQDNLRLNVNRKSFGFYHLDEQNSTAFITGKNQGIQNFYQYDVFGNVRRERETLHNRILYTGQQYDHESNQYYLRARYYNPTLGRFTEEDVYRGDGLNLYDCCKGNPVVWYDPSGYEKQKNKNGDYSDTKFENKNRRETVTYRRVQGGAGNQSSQQRIYIDDNGNVYINKKIEI